MDVYTDLQPLMDDVVNSCKHIEDDVKAGMGELGGVSPNAKMHFDKLAADLKHLVHSVDHLEATMKANLKHDKKYVEKVDAAPLKDTGFGSKEDPKISP